MSGHSKWHSIKHKKAAKDAKVGKIFTRHGKLITIAARDGGGDPDTNPALRAAITNAKADNMPNVNIERAVKRGSGELDADKQLLEIFYEGFGPGGTAFYIQAITDNKNRSYTNIRTIMSKNGGNLGEAGSVGWMFERKGMINIDLAGRDPEQAQLDLIESGADDFDLLDANQIIAYCSDEQTQAVAEAVSKAGYNVTQKELTFLPKQSVELLDQNVVAKFLKLIDLLDDDEDVQTVYTNAEFEDQS